jgi:hypothetical protein
MTVLKSDRGHVPTNGRLGTGTTHIGPHATVAEHIREIIEHLRDGGCADARVILWPAEMEEQLAGHPCGPDDMVIDLPDSGNLEMELHQDTATGRYAPSPADRDKLEVVALFLEQHGIKVA